MTIAALTITPYAFVVGGMEKFGLHLLVSCVAMAVLSSALPYALEMKALRVLPGRTFSVLMSLEPVIAALCGLVLLGEHLTQAQWAAVALVVIASAGGDVIGRESRREFSCALEPIQVGGQVRDTFDHVRECEPN